MRLVLMMEDCALQLAPIERFKNCSEHCTSETLGIPISWRSAEIMIWSEIVILNSSSGSKRHCVHWGLLCSQSNREWCDVQVCVLYKGRVVCILMFVVYKRRVVCTLRFVLFTNRGACVRQGLCCVQNQGWCVHWGLCCVQNQGWCVHWGLCCVQNHRVMCTWGLCCVQSQGWCVHWGLCCVQSQGWCVHWGLCCVQNHRVMCTWGLCCVQSQGWCVHWGLCCVQSHSHGGGQRPSLDWWEQSPGCTHGESQLHCCHTGHQCRLSFHTLVTRVDCHSTPWSPE